MGNLSNCILIKRLRSQYVAWSRTGMHIHNSLHHVLKKNTASVDRAEVEIKILSINYIIKAFDYVYVYLLKVSSL